MSSVSIEINNSYLVNVKLNLSNLDVYIQNLFIFDTTLSMNCYDLTFRLVKTRITSTTKSNFFITKLVTSGFTNKLLIACIVFASFNTSTNTSLARPGRVILY